MVHLAPGEIREVECSVDIGRIFVEGKGVIHGHGHSHSHICRG